MIKAVFFDVDGTLVSFDTHKVPKTTLDAIVSMQEKGIKVFVATGRHQSILTLGNNVHEINFDGYVTLNGQYCFTKENEVLHEKHISENDIEAIVKFIKEKDVPCGFIEGEQMYVNKIDDVVEKVFTDVNLPLPKVKDIDRALENKVFQLNPYIPVEIEDEFMATMPNSDFTRWSPLFMDVIPAGGGKHVAVQKVMDHYGYKKDEVMAFGDGENDITMLKAVGIGVAMGNANQSVKDIADYTTECVDNDGVLKALKHFNVL